MKNKELAQIFYEMFLYLKIQGDEFRAVAYQNASRALNGLNENKFQLI